MENPDKSNKPIKIVPKPKPTWPARKIASTPVRVRPEILAARKAAFEAYKARKKGTGFVSRTKILTHF